MKERQTILKYLGEMANMGFIHAEEYDKIKQRIEARYNGLGKK